jgi:hypothetical protein
MKFTYTVKCESCYHTLREEHRLRRSKNMVQREIFVCRREEVTENKRKLQTEELHGFFLNPY